MRAAARAARRPRRLPRARATERLRALSPRAGRARADLRTRRGARCAEGRRALRAAGTHRVVATRRVAMPFAHTPARGLGADRVRPRCGTVAPRLVRRLPRDGA